MRITTLVKNYFSYFILLLFLFGYNNFVYSQCPTVTNSNQSFCDTQLPTIANLVATNNGGGIKWYATATSTTALSNGTSLINGEDYFADDNTGSCGARQNVIVTIYTAPTGANFQGVCVASLSQATPSNPQFVISGNNLQWYTTSTGGTPISNSTILTDNTIYYISQTNPNTGCETSRLQLFVNIGLVPVPTGSSVQEFCNNNPRTVNDLVASGNNNWYLTSTFGTPLDLTTLLVNGQHYYATTIDPPCESSERLDVLVNIYEHNNAGNDGNKGICIDQVSSTTPFDLFNLLGGTPDNTGVWTGPITTSNGSQGTLDVSTMNMAGSPYVFTYTVTSALCPTDTANVTITINPTPTVTVTSPPVCQGTPATVTATPSPSGTYSYAWTVPSGATNPGNVSTFTTTTAGVYSVIITNTATTCPSQLGQTTVVINPTPDAGSDGTKIFCSNGTPEDLFLSLGGTPQTGGVWSPVLSSGTGFFNPAVDIAQTYTYIVGSDCITPSTATVAVSITTAPKSGGIGQTLNSCSNVTSLDLFTGLDGTQQVGNWSDDDVTGALVNNIFNPSSVGVGTYHFTYTVLGTFPCSDATSTVTVIVNTLPDAGTATTIPPVCSSIGILDLASLLNGEDTGGTWTDSATSVVISPLNIINFSAGTYSYTYTVTNSCSSVPDTEVVQFTVLASPKLTTLNVSTSPICIGTNEIVNLSGMVDGIYTLNYDLNGSNVLANQTVVVTIMAGIGSFTIPAASIPNAGTTVISFTSIVNNINTCSSTLTNVTALIIIKPLADIDNTNLSIPNVCIGNNVVINITNAINLPDGVYQFNYSIPGATPVSGNSGNVSITSGTGQFTIPSSSFTTAGNYSLTINGIIATTGCSNASENAMANFSINPLPNVTGATVTAEATCPNFGSTVTISGATILTDGTYSIIYQLTGANSATTTISVTFTSGLATFTIPGSELLNTGDTTITINQLNSTSTTCGISGTIFTPVTFSVITLGPPVLMVDGERFCSVINPTIADLSANIVGTPIVIWYNAPIGGTAYNVSDLLVDGTIYYAAIVSQNGCESQRLSVTVFICNDVIIPDGFSPNNDGINDTFEILNLAILFPNFQLEIYNRYGNLVFNGDKNKANWGGTTTEGGLKLDNNLLPTGVYFYILNFNDGTRKAIQGSVYLNR